MIYVTLGCRLLINACRTFPRGNKYSFATPCPEWSLFLVSATGQFDNPCGSPEQAPTSETQRVNKLTYYDRSFVLYLALSCVDIPRKVMVPAANAVFYVPADQKSTPV